MPVFNITMPDGEHAQHELTKNKITIGRNEDNDIAIEDGSMSGSHAELRKSGDDYVLVDLDSTNGTYVNGTQISSDVVLRNGDAIVFGSIDATYNPQEPAAEDEGKNDDDSGEFPLPESITAHIGESSHRPADFNSISPFPKKKVTKDPVGSLFLMIGALSLLACIAVALTAAIMKSA